MDGETMQILSAEDLCAQFGPKLLKHSRRLLHGHHAAEDYAQEALLKLCKMVKEFPDPRLTTAYATTVLKNLIRTERRKWARLAQRGITFHSIDTLTGTNDVTDRKASKSIRGERAHQLDKLAFDIYLEKFTPEEETIYYLLKIEGMSAEEIATKMKRDVRVIRALRNKLNNRILKRMEKLHRFGEQHSEWRDELKSM